MKWFQKSAVLTLVLLGLLSAFISSYADSFGGLTLTQLAKSDVIVYCDEEKIETQEMDKRQITIVTCKVREAFAGPLKEGDQIKVRYSAGFERIRGDKDHHLKPLPYPAGRALVFVRKGTDGIYDILDARLVVYGQAFKFEQDLIGPVPARQPSLTPQASDSIVETTDALKRVVSRPQLNIKGL